MNCHWVFFLHFVLSFANIFKVSRREYMRDLNNVQVGFQKLCRFVTNTRQSKVFKVFFSFCWIVLKSSHWAHLDPLKAQTFHLSVRSECYFMYIVCIEQCEGHGYLVSGRILILTSPCMQLGERICSHLLHIPFH